MIELKKRLAELSENSFENINSKDENGNTALHSAAELSSAKTVKLLIEKGADVNSKNNQGEIPLHRAAYRGKVKNVKEIIKAGSDVNAVDKFGRSPLYYARNNIELVRLLEKSSGKIIDKSKDIMSEAESVFEGVIDVFEGIMDVFNRLTLPELDGKILQLDEIKKRDKSLIAKDWKELCKNNGTWFNLIKKELGDEKD